MNHFACRGHAAQLLRPQPEVRLREARFDALRASEALSKYLRLVSPHTYQAWRAIFTLPDDYETWRNNLLKLLASFRKDEPASPYWTDEDHFATSPVVAVTHFEAYAYGRWLGRKLAYSDDCPTPLRRLLDAGWKVGLPSEPEWEKAARGGRVIPHLRGELRNPAPSRQWPWQGPFSSTRCNTADGADPVMWWTPVGTYLNGASPYGCLDLVGNVMEWTRSIYEDYPYPENDEDGELTLRELESRHVAYVCRGGSFMDFHVSARCSVRMPNIPAEISPGIGFRLVLSPAIEPD